MSARVRGVVAAIACVAGLAAASALLEARDDRYPVRAEARRGLYLTSPRSAHVLAMGFDTVAADLYWIRAVQHFGGDRLSRPASGAFELLAPLLNLATTLDPHFLVAYRFGAVFLAEPPPGGPGRPDQAIALLQKGLAADPNRWQLAHDIAFVYLWHYNDRESLAKAAEWFDRASRMPHAPPWLKPVVTTVLAGADREAARASLRELASQGDQVWIRRYAERTLAQLGAMDDIDHLQPIVDRFRAAHPLSAITWEALVRAGAVSGVFGDATGTPYLIDADGRVTISPRSPLAPLPAPRLGRGRQ